MAYVLACRLTLGTKVPSLDFTSGVGVRLGWQELTSTASISIPRQYTWQGQDLSKLLKVGDAVTIELGYAPTLRTVFTGFIQQVKPTTPLEIVCEDQMFLLKRRFLTKSWQAPRLSTVLDALLEGTGLAYNAVDTTIGDVQLERATPAKALEVIRETYGLQFWFQDGVLQAGQIYAQGSTPAQLHFQRNIAAYALEFRAPDSDPLRVTVIINRNDGTTEEIALGDENGAERTLPFPDIPTAEARARGEALLERLRYTGYRGTVTTFGEPAVAVGGQVQLSDDIYPERAGTFFVDAVEHQFGPDGYRQVITLGPSAA